jgi:hypothetical protein
VVDGNTRSPPSAAERPGSLLADEMSEALTTSPLIDSRLMLDEVKSPPTTANPRIGAPAPPRPTPPRSTPPVGCALLSTSQPAA